MKKSLLFRLLLFVLIFAMALPGTAVSAENNAVANPYTYVLKVAKKDGQYLDGTTKNAEGQYVFDKTSKIQLELYIIHKNMNDNAPRVDAGTFALRYPSFLGGKNGANLTFAPKTTNVSTVPVTNAIGSIANNIDGEGKSNKTNIYQAFTWSINPNVKDGLINDVGYGIHIGTYTFKFDDNSKLPNKSSIGLLNWLVAEEAIPVPNTPDNSTDPFNRSIWDKATSSYIGYYLPEAADKPIEDLEIVPTNIGFSWTPSPNWAGGMSVLSYDPKKTTSFRLYQVDGDISTLIGQGKAKEEDTGQGIFSNNIEIDKIFTPDGTGANYIIVEKDKKYKIVISKPGSLTIEVPNLIGVSSLVSDLKNLPTDEVYLPCGDINPNIDGKYGDGAITLADRSVLLGLLNGSLNNAPKELTDIADLDGDGAVTLGDLSIFMSPTNYGQVTNVTN